MKPTKRYPFLNDTNEDLTGGITHVRNQALLLMFSKIGKYLPPRNELSDYYLYFLSTRAERLFWKNRWDEILPTFTVASELYEMAYQKRSSNMCELAGLASLEYSQIQEELYYTIKDDTEANGPIVEIFRAKSRYYIFLYESAFKILSSLAAYSKDIINGVTDSDMFNAIDYIFEDSIHKARKLDSPLIISTDRISVLVGGANNHIRNAIAHFRFRVDENDEIHLKDKKWRRCYTLESFQQILDKLSNTVFALELSLIAFCLRHPAALDQAVLTRQSVMSLVHAIAETMGFSASDIEVDMDKKLITGTFTARLWPEGETYAMIGFAEKQLSYKIAPRKWNLSEQLVGALERIAAHLKENWKLKFFVNKGKAEPAGEVVVISDSLLQITNEKISFNDAKAFFEKWDVDK